jgi:hypothetical protein
MPARRKTNPRRRNPWDAVKLGGWGRAVVEVELYQMAMGRLGVVCDPRRTRLIIACGGERGCKGDKGEWRSAQVSLTLEQAERLGKEIRRFVTVMKKARKEA